MTPQLEFAFRVTLEFPAGPRLRYAGASGEARGYVSITGGSVSGPRLEGSVIAGSGGDWPLFRNDGVIAFDARYLLRASDGTVIHLINRGYAYAQPEVQQRIERGESVDPKDNYFRLAPVFDAPAGPHDWLTRTILIGVGEKHARHSTFDYFAVL